ncbi:MAG TPA: HNH endonuclease [Bryobacteraceae bacterium]|nr:HNH endonuclease [Bryobacteraceae bacterium]
MPATNEIISYLEMCQRESMSLQRGMNFDFRRGYSVILMSVRPNAPYRDRFQDDGATLIYEGHDAPRTQASPDPKAIDQPEFLPSGSPTQNHRFYEAAQSFRLGLGPPHRVRVYEKIHQGIWSYNGLFHLVDAWREPSEGRSVFKFKLVVVDAAEEPADRSRDKTESRRLIPTQVKIEVWNRDKGRCVLCGAADELHFDHVLPYSKGGTSITASNVQLLCARHNLSKGAKIE